MLHLAIMFQLPCIARGTGVGEGGGAGILRLMEVNPAVQSIEPLEKVVKEARILKTSGREILAMAGFLPADIGLNTGAVPPLESQARFVYHFYQVGGSNRFNQLLKLIYERFQRTSSGGSG